MNTIVKGKYSLNITGRPYPNKLHIDIPSNLTKGATLGNLNVINTSSLDPILLNSPNGGLLSQGIKVGDIAYLNLSNSLDGKIIQYVRIIDINDYVISIEGTLTENNSDYTGGLTLYSGGYSDSPNASLVNPFVEKVSELRYGNSTKVRMEIRYGKDDKLFKLRHVYVDYLKSPQFVRLTQTEIDEVEDRSSVMEFPDYVCQEIINELIRLLMENASDPRLQTHIPINQSIGSPQQDQQPQR